MFIEKYNGTGGCLAVIRVRVTYFDCDFCCPAIRFWQTVFSCLLLKFSPCDYRIAGLLFLEEST